MSSVDFFPALQPAKGGRRGNKGIRISQLNPPLDIGNLKSKFGHFCFLVVFKINLWNLGTQIYGENM
jgi:hypothetical protein